MSTYELGRDHRNQEPDTPPMMDCGHAANGVQVLEDGTRIPVCVIDAIARPDDREYGTRVVETPVLTDRKARCAYFGRKPHKNESNYGCRGAETCDCEPPSKLGLPFFEHKPDAGFDTFYCGCWGWD